MRKTIWDARMPTILGLLLIISGLFVTQKLVQNGTIVIGHASVATTPKEIRFSNVSSTSFAISFKTDGATIGSINMGTTKEEGTIIADDRDKNGSTSAHKLHYFTIRNLQPKTTYYLTLLSGSDTYLNKNVPFEITTIPTDSNTTEGDPISGKIITQDGTAPTEAIVDLRISNSNFLSTLVKSDGSYSIPTMNSTFLELLIMSDSQFSTVTLGASASGTIPTITMGKSYDFTKTADAQQNNASDSASLGFSSLTSTERTPISQIITPKKDEKFSDQKPLFKGTAPVGSTVTVTIHSDEQITSKVTTDKNGNWSFRPSSALSPGIHTISVSMEDSSGILRTITQSFTVYAEGSNFTEPSVSPNPTTSPTPTLILIPTPTSVPSPTKTPLITQIPAPTIIPTATPTAIPTPTQVPTSTPIPVIKTTLPPPGSTSFFTASLSAFFIITAGIGLFFLSKPTSS